MAFRHMMATALLLGCGMAAAAGEELRFADYGPGEFVRGPAKLPQFDGRDRWARDFRTRIRDGLKSGTNFAGHYTIIWIGCGASCRFAYVADARNGEVFEFPLGGENNPELEAAHTVESRLLKAVWKSGDECVKQDFVWTGRAFDKLSEERYRPDELYCTPPRPADDGP